MRKGAAWLLLGLALGKPLCAQNAGSVGAGEKAESAGVPTHYDVISVRQNNSGSGNMSMSENDGNVTFTNITLGQMLFDALDIQQDLISGLPGWATSAHYDIQAKVLDADPKVMQHLTTAQDRTLVLSILRDRFGFQSHIEVKTLPVYDLLVAKSGLLIQPVARPAPAEGTEPDGDSTGVNVTNNSIAVTMAGMKSVAHSLISQVQRTVIDKTGLPGQYTFTLKFTPERQLNGAEAGLPDAPPSIYTALEQQLGLKLLADKGPVDTLVVDHVEQPTKN